MLTGWVREQGRRYEVVPDSPIYRGNPLIGPGGKPLAYRDWMRRHGYTGGQRGGRHTYRPFRAYRGDIYVSREERIWAAQFGEGFILVEPNFKGLVGADNRDWGMGNWRALAERLPLVQMSGARRLPCRRIETPSFRHACAILERAAGIVTTNGGLHHAAAALRRPAVVIWGGYNDPAMLGYEDHTNLYVPSPECHGQARSHPACRECMDRITVDMVAEAVRAML